VEENMKTAICFSGLVGSTRGKSQELVGDFKKCFEISSALYKEHIIDKNDVDIFVHSWSTGMQEEILEAYEPKKHIIEQQRIFDIPAHVRPVGADEIRKQTHYSLWYSRKKAMQLKSEYEKENNFKYDCVMLARFDLAWQTDLIFKDYDQECFWTQNWPRKHLNGKVLSDVDYWRLSETPGLKFETEWVGYPHNHEGLMGMWFFSNSDNMDKFATFYDRQSESCLPGNCPGAPGVPWKISAHRQCLYHLEQLGMLDKLKFCKNWHDDCPSVRRRYFKER
tara:strand:+ start:364 stop:1200 length:837 start_codon:yes stop_codon:yes gene_type:complete